MDDRKVVSGIIHVLRSGLRSCGCPTRLQPCQGGAAPRLMGGTQGGLTSRRPVVWGTCPPSPQRRAVQGLHRCCPEPVCRAPRPEPGVGRTSNLVQVCGVQAGFRVITRVLSLGICLISAQPVDRVERFSPVLALTRIHGFPGVPWHRPTARLGQRPAQRLDPAWGENPWEGSPHGKCWISLPQALGCGTVFQKLECCHLAHVPLTFQPVDASSATRGGDTCRRKEGGGVMDNGEREGDKEILSPPVRQSASPPVRQSASPPVRQSASLLVQTPFWGRNRSAGSHIHTTSWGGRG